jgi:hypothetical protein
MSSYSLYVPGNGDLARAKLIRDGGVLAFWLPAVYLGLHRLWFGLAAYVLAILATLLAGGLIGGGPMLILLILASVFVWLEGGQMRRRALERRGWNELGTVNAANRDEAELRLFALAEPTMPAAAPDVGQWPVVA